MFGFNARPIHLHLTLQCGRFTFQGYSSAAEPDGIAVDSLNLLPNLYLASLEGLFCWFAHFMVSEQSSLARTVRWYR